MLQRLKLQLLGRIQRGALLAVAAVQHAGPLPDLGATVEVETTFARLLLDEADEWITPTLTATAGWEPGQTALLGERIKPGMTVVDGGAHVGYFTCQAARLVGPRGLVLAFEPAPRNFELLRANVWRNGFTNVVCFPWALGGEPALAQLHLSSSNTGDHSLHGDDASRPSETVRVAALDQVIAIRPPIHVVKLDVQGSEEAAVRGMERLLAGSPDVLLTVELSPTDARAAGSDLHRLLGYYRSLGFALRVQLPDEKGLVDLADHELLRRAEELEHVNLVLERLN
ncbi:MAG TPA: FkbM family methyltransferase [Gaiellaceae bacterium]|nr:FkbM family methyltransferase [Gaiellaceae bacterium]